MTSDPGESTQVLTNQLRSLGLYAANTLGDGNCLFRALSDQYYGSPSRHVEVRRDVCNWIERHQERYEGFVDEDEFGSGGGQNKVYEYLQRMRENGEYMRYDSLLWRLLYKLGHKRCHQHLCPHLVATSSGYLTNITH